MLPLTVAPFDMYLKLVRMIGTADVKRHLESLGFKEDCLIVLLHNKNGDVLIKSVEGGNAVAIDEKTASGIWVVPS
jgi:Fe2+ transport system protein FeoA